MTNRYFCVLEIQINLSLAFWFSCSMNFVNEIVQKKIQTIIVSVQFITRNKKIQSCQFYKNTDKTNLLNVSFLHLITARKFFMITKFQNKDYY